jgi:hypothetical protein
MGLFRVEDDSVLAPNRWLPPSVECTAVLDIRWVIISKLCFRARDLKSFSKAIRLENRAVGVTEVIVERTKDNLII